MESIKSTNNNCVQYKCFNFCSFYSYLNNRRPFPCRVYIASSRHKGTYSRVCITFASSHNLRVCRCMRLHKYSIAFIEYSQNIKTKGKVFLLTFTNTFSQYTLELWTIIFHQANESAHFTLSFKVILRPKK